MLGAAFVGVVAIVAVIHQALAAWWAPACCVVGSMVLVAPVGTHLWCCLFYKALDCPVGTRVVAGAQLFYCERQMVEAADVVATTE